MLKSGSAVGRDEIGTSGMPEAWNERTPVKARKFYVTGAGFLQLVSIIALLLIWELIAFIVGDEEILPTPIRVAEAIVDLTEQNGGLWQAALVSAEIFVIGLLIAIVLAIPIGTILGTSRFASRAFRSWLTLFWATPVIAILPLLVSWFGLTTLTQLIVVVASAFFPIVVNTQVGFEGVDPPLLDAARAFGATRLRVLVRVRVPAAMPVVAAGIRVAVGRAVIGVIVAELFISASGLGGKMTYYANFFQMSNYFAALVIFAFFSVIVTECTSILEHRATRYRD